jgi:hypothetical protein
VEASAAAEAVDLEDSVVAEDSVAAVLDGVFDLWPK